MATIQEITDAVIDIIDDHIPDILGDDPMYAEPEDMLCDLGLSSIHIEAIAIDVEDGFRISIKDADISRWYTVKDIVDCVASKTPDTIDLEEENENE